LRDILKVDISYITINNGFNEIPNSKVDPQNFCNALRGLNAVGGAISKDIKGSVHPFLDDVDDLAKEIGSVNTVVRIGNKLKGYNTDAIGFKVAIENVILRKVEEGGDNVKQVRKAVCYGYGGVCNVVVACLRSMNIQVYITGRSIKTATARAKELRVEVYNRNIHGQCELFVNATPVTDAPLESAVNFLETLKGCTVAFDHELVGKYLVNYCKNNNVTHISGKAMYWPQMVQQWKLFLKGKIDDNILNHLLEHLQKAEELANDN
jgi:shikimate dehydrogenase